MSGHEEHHDHHDHQAHIEAMDDNIIGSSVVLPIARRNILDYIYLSGISLLPVYGSGGGGGGGASWNQHNEMDQAMASILSGSLYERNPVKKVIDDEACCEIKEYTFTAALAEQQKINSACGIWQEEFEEGEAIKILPCNHAFKSEAITKWLKEEKAECPICRQTLKSKEICCHENRDDDDGNNDHNENGEMYENDYAGADNDEHEPEPQSELNNDAIRINNIASRMIQSVAGRMHSNPHHGHQESISVPISHLIERRRNMIFQARNLVAARAAIPSSSGAAAAPYSNAHREVRAVPGINEYNRINNNRINNNRVDDNNNNNNRVDEINPPILNIINNNYYYNNINNNDNNNNNNDNNNNNEDLVSNQEQADIEEAIRRSLEQM